MDTNLKSWEVEQLRRSVAMLSPNAPNALNREEAMKVLDHLRRVLVELEHTASRNESERDP